MQIDVESLEKIRSFSKPTLIAISGFGGSGKSTTAQQLAHALGAPVVSVDSFQKKGAFDTHFTLWEIMDFSRLEKEVLMPFSRGEQTIQYGHFDAKEEEISETREIQNNGLLIVEGVGLFRPELATYFTYKIWIDCPIEEAAARGKKRDREEYGNPTDELWDGVWKDNDREYFEIFKPAESADLLVPNG